MGCAVVHVAPHELKTRAPEKKSAKHILQQGILQSDVELIRLAFTEKPGIVDEELAPSAILPLELAVSLGHSTAVRELLSNKAELKTHNGRNMLSIAIAGDKEAERAKKLMSEHKMKEKPTEGNCNDDEKSTSGLKESNVDELPLACDQSKKEVIELLVQAKCSVNHQDGGFTPIQRAVTLGLPETCELLLEKKADITVLNEKKQNLVHLLASEKSWPGVVYNERIENSKVGVGGFQLSPATRD
ncbi:hypothetical protein AAMO2058_000107900 [Amorphochlora amoebiformis]